MNQRTFLGLGLSVVLSSTALAACSSDTASPGAGKSDASAGGSSAGGSSSSAGGKTGTGGTTSTGGTTGTGGTKDAGAGGSTTATGGTDAGQQADAAPPAQCGTAVDAGAMCNDLVNTASDVTLVAATGTMPTGVGGPIGDGLYYNTRLAYYPGSSLAGNVLTTRQLVLVCGNTFQHVEDPATKPEARSTSTVILSGNTFTDTEICNTKTPIGIPWSSYTATATAFTIYSASLGFEAVFTKQ